MYGMMYSPDKMMMNPKPLGPPAIGGTNCFSGRYSPTYRVPEQMRDPMRRCMTNPPVSFSDFPIITIYILTISGHFSCPVPRIVEI